MQFLAGTGSLDATSSSPLKTVYGIGSLVAVPALTYHGYKRNNSVGWAPGWAAISAFFWPIAGAVALAQGFGKPKRRANRRHSRRRTRR